MILPSSSFGVIYVRVWDILGKRKPICDLSSASEPFTIICSSPSKIPMQSMLRYNSLAALLLLVWIVEELASLPSTRAFAPRQLPRTQQPHRRVLPPPQTTTARTSRSFTYYARRRRTWTRLHESQHDKDQEQPQSNLNNNRVTIPSLASSLQKKRTNYRMRLFAWLNLPAVEVVLALAVLLSSLLVAVATMDNLPLLAESIVQDALLALNLLLAVDFVARWYAAGQFKWRYLTKPLVLIDLIVIWVPLFVDVVLPLLDMAGILTTDTTAFWYSLQNTAGLQNLLLLRVLRLRRVLTDIGTFRRFGGALGIVKAKDVVRPYQLQVARVLLSLVTLLSVASGLIYTAEHDVNPGIDNYFDALYFGLTSLTTVGFGDVVPVTVQGRLVVMASIIAGVAVIPAQAAKLVEALIDFQRDDKLTVMERRRMEKKGFNNRRAQSSKHTVRKVTDGKGPGGIPIETPTTMDWCEIFQRNDYTLMDTSRSCYSCDATYHWSDADFCWYCGNSMRNEPDFNNDRNE